MWRKLTLFTFALSFVGCASTTPMPEIRVHKTSPNCRPLSLHERIKILKLASPKNFPKSKYRMGPRSPANIEKETDCSRFVHEIYRRAGYPYQFRPTAHLSQAPEFDVLDEDEAKPGDLMLFRGHVGLVDKDGKIISATKVRSKKQSTITKMDRENFKGFRGRRFVLRYRCKPISHDLASKSRP
jgi:hypothetical protein